MVNLLIQTPTQQYQLRVSIKQNNVCLEVSSEIFETTRLQLSCSEHDIAVEQYYYLLRIIANNFVRKLDETLVRINEVQMLNKLSKIIAWLSKSWSVLNQEGLTL